jgi:hypothetical protein
MSDPWVALTLQAARLTWEAQGVMALRMLKLARGGRAAQSEARVMITEKAVAFSKAQAVATAAVLGGSNGTRTAKKVLNIYNNKVRSNRRRLSK